ncbi:phytoene desaturase family protein [Kordiimonas gwangyangensis]|uniref:phytoene desaturase family protein n=1 Tax=Kordiimonas gwangyangensis TaxID=288022 RepID=UPI000A4B051E|nr:NAD(P)/FAD-dependent oxidoreductase [Kordiimonas gwangyangensis]
MYDVVIVGGGHNGLTCAFYLAKAGLKPLVLEKRSVVGGAAVTEEFHPGFRNSSASYTVSLLNPKIIKDMELARHGLKVVERAASNFFPLDDKNYLMFPSDGAAKRREFAKFSEKDAQALERYEDDIEAVADELRALLLKSPPNAAGGMRDLMQAASLGLRTLKQPIEAQRLFLDMATQSCADMLDRYFESDVIKAAYAFDGIVGAFTSARAGYCLCAVAPLFWRGERQKRRMGTRHWRHGGDYAGNAQAASEAGAEVRTDCEVAEVLTGPKGACGVRLADGTVIDARAVAAGVAPKLLFSKLVDESLVPEDFSKRIKGLTSGSGTFRMNVALKELPQFTCLPSDGVAPHHSSGIVIGPSIEYLETAT